MNPVARALLWSLILVGVVVGAIWMLSGREKGGLETRAVRFFEVYWSEDFGVGDTMLTRAMLSPLKRTEYEKARDYYMKTLGSWGGAYEVLSIDSDGDGGGKVVIRGSFEKGKAVVRFELRVDLGVLKIADIVVEIPRDKTEKADWHDPRVFARKLLLRWSEGHVDVTWEQFDERMRRRYPLEIFRAATKTFRAEAGDIGEITVDSVDESDADRPVVTLKATYGKAERPATIALAWIASRWRVWRFEVEGLK